MENQNRAEQQARAQCESICRMIGAIDLDWERLEELREKKKAGYWLAGWNMPGYLPDAEPAQFETCDEARAYIAQSLGEDADSAEDEGFSEIAQSLRAAAEALQKDIQETPDSEWGQTLSRFHYWITHQPGALPDDEEKELSELESGAGDWESGEDAEQAVYEDPLSIEVRSDWVNPGEEMQPAEFRIVLCTGGPHVEIMGDLDHHGAPSRPRVLFRDWGESGELSDFPRDSVQRYCEMLICL